MGNGLVSQVGSTTTATTPATFSTGFNTSFGNPMAGGLFGMPKDYSNDFMMPTELKTGNITDEQRASIFGPMYVPTQQQQVQQPQQAQVQPQYQQQMQYPQQQIQPQAQYPQQYAQYPQTQNPYAPAFSGQQTQEQAQMLPEQVSEYYEKLMAENPNIRITEKGNVYEVTNSGKQTGILAGIGTALAGGIVKLCKGAGLSSAFNLKSLAIKVPALAIAGWAIGSVIDAFTNSNRKQQADAQPQQV